MNIATILAGALGVGLLGGGAMTAWDRWQGPSDLALAKTAGKDAPNPIAPGLAGKLECAGPNRVLRTCFALSSYSGNASLGYVSTTTFAAGPSPGGLITMRMTVPIRVEGNLLCGTLERKMIMQAELFLNSRPMPSVPAALDLLAKTLEPRLGKEDCTQYVEQGGTIVAKSFEDGRAMPERDMTILWVEPRDGYGIASLDG